MTCNKAISTLSPQPFQTSGADSVLIIKIDAIRSCKLTGFVLLLSHSGWGEKCVAFRWDEIKNLFANKYVYLHLLEIYTPNYLIHCTMDKAFMFQCYTTEYHPHPFWAGTYILQQSEQFLQKIINESHNFYHTRELIFILNDTKHVAALRPFVDKDTLFLVSNPRDAPNNTIILGASVPDSVRWRYQPRAYDQPQIRDMFISGSHDI